ncbi:MAG: hypothetical protein ACJ716_05080 [Marmoricola sp.]
MTSQAEDPVLLPRALRALPWALLALTTVLDVVMVPLSLGQEPLSDTVLSGLNAFTVAVVGALLASRLPTNPIGWIMCVQGVVKIQLETWGEGFHYHHLPTAAAGVWVADWSWLLDGAAYVLVFALFPTGMLLSPRWRWILWALGPAVVLSIAGRQGATPLFAIGMVVYFACAVGSVASVVVRFRRSHGLERLQLKQLVLAGILLLPAIAVSIPFYEGSVLVQSFLAVAFLALPVAVGVAILRYRLYDIDVIINRTLVYLTLTATLAGTYLGTVLLLQLVLNRWTAGSSLAVAVSTLTVAALFGPARGRIQTAVDRRFFRAKYNASLTVARFSGHLRDQVDLADIGGDLLTVVHSTVQPAHASLWLRPEGGDR